MCCPLPTLSMAAFAFQTTIWEIIQFWPQPLGRKQQERYRKWQGSLTAFWVLYKLKDRWEKGRQVHKNHKIAKVKCNKMWDNGCSDRNGVELSSPTFLFHLHIHIKQGGRRCKHTGERNKTHHPPSLLALDKDYRVGPSMRPTEIIASGSKLGRSIHLHPEVWERPLPDIWAPPLPVNADTAELDRH